jgi:hypothetical protein
MATKKTTTKKAPKKANTAPKSRPMPNGESVHAGEAKREVRWSDRRIAVVKAMRKLGAVSQESARTAGEIAKKAGIKEDDVAKVKIILDVYRVTELLHNDYAKSYKEEGVRELRYFLTKKGREAVMVNQ